MPKTPRDLWIDDRRVLGIVTDLGWIDDSKCPVFHGPIAKRLTFLLKEFTD